MKARPDTTHDMREEALAAQALLHALRNDLDGEDDAELVIASETNLKETMREALLAIEQDEASAAALEGSVQRLKARQARLAGRAQRVRGAILAALELVGARKLELPEATVSVGKGRARVIVTDEAAIPMEFMRETVRRAPDLKALGEALQAGPINGVLLSNAAPVLTVRKV